ncbi:hypothetical protein GOP47_0017166 [Adiantum capillus-veneris]|uniref:Uncharacterized protein n=1 Tax=Adiantum capillus-veneris TaxID=13818 RepID=A0A9D4UK06_ADICA|nr:hypothetical protein GOP47_0017166 [Adiantum capillus-veneris]
MLVCQDEIEIILTGANRRRVECLLNYSLLHSSWDSMNSPAVKVRGRGAVPPGRTSTGVSSAECSYGVVRCTLHQQAEVYSPCSMTSWQVSSQNLNQRATAYCTEFSEVHAITAQQISSQNLRSM